MDFLRHLFDSQWAQRRDIDGLRDSLGRAARTRSTLRRRVHELEDRVTRLAEENEMLRGSHDALVELLVRRGTIARAELPTQVDESHLLS